MPRVVTRILRIASLVVFATALWLAYEWLGHLHAHRIVDQGTPAEAVVFMPGLSFLVLYTGLAIIVLIPPALIGLTLLIPDKEPHSNPDTIPLSPAKMRFTVFSYGAFSMAGIAISSAIGGYVYEASHTEVRITRQTLAYKAGPYEAYLPLRDIRRMELRWKARNRQVEMMSQAEDVNIDLSAFAPRDQELLLNVITVYANLSRVRNRNPDVIVWRRIGPSRVIGPEQHLNE